MGKKTLQLNDAQQTTLDGVLNTLAERVYNLRKARSLSGRALAAKAGIAHPTVVAIEGGAINVSIAILVLLAQALEVDISVFFDVGFNIKSSDEAFTRGVTTRRY
ncbi:hypothetical protein CCR94_02425 [Rhodoblastus sphagnicola]|uniref:Uncharacterized protein n=1 Tax=Rhodoblastus sphagnicola TaxID=333368 RepID=A0A2S6NF93_9HYPH|nr:helix-turn-helix transcriptional regulator [Rhodoblastus sphagnicola]MBB4200239.1 transcriptional regulator with XRE-family HTH domain [Rhodoblastus sphagnicola]PPQ33276.1 hypothetical protein CCR94_02425 [Rhodoblastus sphagnicola]